MTNIYDDENLSTEWQVNDFHLRTYHNGVQDDGRARVAYLFAYQGDLIFAGYDLHLGAMSATGTIDEAMVCLGFLSLRPGDTDSEYFDGYSDAQMAFAEAEGEELGIYPYEWKNAELIEGIVYLSSNGESL